MQPTEDEYDEQCRAEHEEAEAAEKEKQQRVILAIVQPLLDKGYTLAEICIALENMFCETCIPAKRCVDELRCRRCPRRSNATN